MQPTTYLKSCEAISQHTAAHANSYASVVREPDVTSMLAFSEWVIPRLEIGKEGVSH